MASSSHLHTPVCYYSFLKKVFSSFLDRFICEKEILASKLYQKYAASFVLYIYSKISFVPLLGLNMAENDRNELPLKSVREEMGLDSSGAGEPHLDDFDTFIKSNFERQADISSSMLEMVRTLKATSMEANNLVRRDIKRLDQAKHLAEGNMEALKNTSEKLTVCSRTSMNWGLIGLAALVFMIFLFMVFLMRILKKN